MATKRIKSFSPYSYSIQYAKAGEGPAQKPHPYVNAAIMPEEHFVVAKKEPNFYVYVSNTARFTLDDECVLTFNGITTKFMVVGKDSRPDVDSEYDLTEVKDESKVSYVCDLCKNDDAYVTWLSDTDVQIKHYLDHDVDCIILADSKYIKAKKKFSTKNWMTLRFGEGFSRSTYEHVYVLVYKIGNEAFPIMDVDESQISYDKVNDVVAIGNLFKTNKCIAMLFDEDGWAYPFENVDLTPSRILFKADEVEVIEKTTILNELSFVDDRIEQIIAENALVPLDALTEMNEEFRTLKARKAELNRRLEKIGDEDRFVNVVKALVYKSEHKTFTKSLRHGVDESDVVWHGSTAVVTHSLGGYVNIVVDDTLASDTSFTARYIDDKTVSLEFARPKFTVCNVRMFKIGEAER